MFWESCEHQREVEEKTGGGSREQMTRKVDVCVFPNRRKHCCRSEHRGRRGWAAGVLMCSLSIWSQIQWSLMLKKKTFSEAWTSSVAACVAFWEWSELLSLSVVPEEKMGEICSSFFSRAVLSKRKVRSTLFYGSFEKSSGASLLACNIYRIGGTVAVPHKCRLTQSGKVGNIDLCDI